MLPLGGSEIGSQQGGRRRGASVKTLKRMLKKAGLKTSGRKAALTRRAKKAHLKMRGGVVTGPDGEGKYMSSVTGMSYGTKAEADAADAPPAGDGGRRRRRGTRSRKH